MQAAHDYYLRLVSVDLQAYGLAMPGPFSPDVGYGSPPRIPVFDVDDYASAVHDQAGNRVAEGNKRETGRPGVIELITTGRVRPVRGRLQRFTSTGVVLGPPHFSLSACTNITMGDSAKEDGAAPVATASSSANQHSPYLEVRRESPFHYDKVILATGFKPGLEDMLAAHPELLGPVSARGYMRCELQHVLPGPC